MFCYANNPAPGDGHGAAGRSRTEAARGFGFEIRDPQRFAQNMARLVEETGKAVTAFVEPRVGRDQAGQSCTGDGAWVRPARPPDGGQMQSQHWGLA